MNLPDTAKTRFWMMVTIEIRIRKHYDAVTAFGDFERAMRKVGIVEESIRKKITTEFVTKSLSFTLKGCGMMDKRTYLCIQVDRC